MKKNDWLILLSASAYTYLFFEQDAGINFFLFSILLVLLCIYRNTAIARSKEWLTVATGTILTAIAVFYFGTSLPVWANIFSCLLLASYSFKPSSSLFISVLHFFYSLFLTIPHIFTRLFNSKNTIEQGHSNGAKKFVLILLPSAVALLFFFLYRASNPLFEQVTNQLNFDFISFYWLCFTLYGLVLMYVFFYQQTSTYFSLQDYINGNNLSEISEDEHNRSFIASILSLPSELFTATVLFVLLNLLLMSVNATDIYFLYILNHLPDSLTLSEYLHDGTNSLIVSILLAISVILFFFRGRINFIAKNKLLRILCYGWIAQNIMVVASTINRNIFYVSNFGLTHKRIGVYIFLGLCLVGLITTFIKVIGIKSNWFLFRKNTWVWYLVLIIACGINWNKIIATHNIKLAQNKGVNLDTYYLANLDYTALATLYRLYAQENSISPTSTVFDATLLITMQKDYENLKTEVAKSNWQSTCLIKVETCNSIERSLIASKKTSLK